MTRKSLARHQTHHALQLLGAAGAADPLAALFQPFPGLFNHPAGESGGGAAGGGSGQGGGTSSGSGARTGAGGDEDEDDDGDGPGAGKRVADMTPEEQAKHWRTIARRNERRAKAAPPPEELAKLQEAAAELEKIRDGQRTDTERAVKRAETAESKLADLEPKLLRLEVAMDKGLSKTLAARLVGRTREELEADADQLLREFPTAAGGGQGASGQDRQRAGRRALDQGTRGTRQESRGSVASGEELYQSRHKRNANN